jgi:hypothetical protein
LKGGSRGGADKLMAVSDDILRSYRAPGAVVARILASGRREDRALAILIGAGLLIFIGQWPGAARAAHLDPAVPLQARLSGALMATLFILPLAAYLLAGLSHLAARAMGGRGSFYSARVALFWALLAVAPLMLLHGLVAGFIGPGPGLTLVGTIVFAAFLWIWIAGLVAAERDEAVP